MSVEGFWFYLAGEQRQGPVTLEELVRMLHSAEDPHNVLVWQAGLTDWQAAGSFPEINRQLPPPRSFVQPRADAGGGVSFETAENVARLYRRLVLLVGLQILLGCVQIPMVEAPPSIGIGLISLAASLVLLVTLVALAVTAYKLAPLLGEGLPILWAIAMFLPCINIITLLVLSGKAQAWCQRYGIKVGLLGPKPESIEELQRRGVTSKFE